MYKSTFLLLFLLLQLALVTQTYSQEQKQVYEIPSKYFSLLIVSDPKCPIQIDTPRVIKYEKGSFERVFTVRNSSDKSVMSFQIKQFSWFGNADFTMNPKAIDETSFLPFESFSTLTNENKLEFIDFNEKLVGELGLINQPRDIWIVMVTKAKLSNGTIYDATLKYKIIEKFVENLGINSKTSASEIDKKETELHEFIRKTIDK